MNHPTARGPRYRQLPLWRDAQRFMLEVECAVRAFPRDLQYTLGSTAAAAAQSAAGTSAPSKTAPDAPAPHIARF